MTRKTARRIVVWSVSLVIAAGAYWAIRLWRTADSSAPHDRPAAVADNGPLPFEPPKIKPSPPTDYAGSQSCRECHADVADKYRMHPMQHSVTSIAGRSLEESTGEASRFSLPRVSGTTSTQSYFVERDDASGMIHHEVATDKNGETIYDLAVPVQYTIGSGQRARSYVANRDGLLFMSPLTWYSEKARWDLSPGYQLNNMHFGRRIVEACVNCHAGRVSLAGDFSDHFQATPFLEESISCERCHGPSQSHVDYWREGKHASGTDPILQLGALTPVQQNHLCYQCHLVGEQRVTRVGRTDFDFRPGDHLDEVWTIILKGSRDRDDQTMNVVNQVEQMRGSQCFLKSEQRLTCTSCHDPHSVPEPSRRDEHFRQQCLKCHGSPGNACALPESKRLSESAMDSCIQCHMPRLAAKDVLHTSQTDHRILRRRPPPSTATGKPKAQLYVFEEGDRQIPPAEADRAGAIAMVRIAKESRNSVAAAEAIPKLETWLKVVPDDLAAIDALGLAYFLIQEYPLAAAHWERGLQLAPGHEHFLRQLFLLYHESQQFEKGLEYGKQLTEMNAWDHEYFGRYAHMLGRAGDLTKAAEAGERALELNPAASQIHTWLAELYQAQGNRAAAERHRKLSDAFMK
ncbi:MAG TPA: multiheme c-type cytochrome [Planctomycetaceae bacterium]|nr:multiheme c-type cytochrome [Planctomycetaceae bacterium]